MTSTAKHVPIGRHLRDSEHGIDRAILRIIRSYCGSAASDVLDDCLQEARLSLWLARERLSRLEEPMRSHYAGACIRNATSRHLRTELRYKNLLSPLEELARASGGVTYARSDRSVGLLSGEWLNELEMPDVAGAVAGLPVLERKILSLYYGHGMTDREIAIETSATIGSVVKRRSRAIRRLRQSANHEPS